MYTVLVVHALCNNNVFGYSWTQTCLQELQVTTGDQASVVCSWLYRGERENESEKETV